MKPPAAGSKWEQVMKLRLARAAGKRLNRLTEAPASKPIPAPVPASAQPQEKTMKTKSKAKKSTGPKRGRSEAAANLRKAKASAKPRVKGSKKSATDNARAPAGVPGGVREGSKLAIVVGLLTRDGGCTGKEILEATKWPTVSVPQQARAAGLTLSKEKVDGVTRYSASAPASA